MSTVKPARVGADDFVASGATAADLAALPAVESGPVVVPDEAMIGVGRDFAELYATYLEPPPAFFYFAFLTYFGMLVARKVTLESETHPPTRLYTLLLGESADDRKSTALHKTDEFFKSLGEKWVPRVLFGAGSAEGIAAEMQETPTLMLHYDELKAFVDKAKREGNTALPMVSTMFERESYDNRTKDKGIYLRQKSLSMVAASTKDTYATLFDHQFMAIGFINRLWLVTATPSKSIPIPKLIPDGSLAFLRDRVVGILEEIDAAYLARRDEHGDGMRARVPLKVDPEAEAMFSEWYRSRPKSTFSKRLDTYAMRLMVLLSVTSGRWTVDVDVMTAVLALVRYQYDARQECDPIDADSEVAKMEERIRRVLARGPRRVRDAMKDCHYERPGLWVWKAAVANLSDAGEVREDKKTRSLHLVGRAGQ